MVEKKKKKMQTFYNQKNENNITFFSQRENTCILNLYNIKNKSIINEI